MQNALGYFYFDLNFSLFFAQLGVQQRNIVVILSLEKVAGNRIAQAKRVRKLNRRRFWTISTTPAKRLFNYKFLFRRLSKVKYVYLLVTIGLLYSITPFGCLYSRKM